MPTFPSRLLFRPVVTCPRLRRKVRIDGDLSDWEGIPALRSLGELEEEPVFSQVFVAWDESGLYIAERRHKGGHRVVVSRVHPETGDALCIWIDTRASQNAHQATRFCHHFIMLPRGAQLLYTRAIAWQADIPCARNRPPLCRPEDIRVASVVDDEGYTLEALLPARILCGVDLRPGSRLGFHYAAHDVSRGSQLWAAPPGLPYKTDPSLWGVLELE